MTSAPARLIAVRCSSATASPSIQPLLGRRLDHRVLAAHVVRRDRHVDLGPGPGDDVEVGERRLHHHHVGALGDVGVDLDERLAGVAPVLLVALAVAAADDLHVDRVAERPVQGAGVLGRVGEDGRRRCGRRRRARRGWRRPGRPSSRSARRRGRRRRPGRARPRRRARAWRRCRPRRRAVDARRSGRGRCTRRRSRSAISTTRSPTSSRRSRERDLHDAVGIEGARCRRRPCAPARRTG